MASYSIKFDNIRPCFVRTADGDKAALFHCWSQESEVYAPSLLRGGHNGGVVAGVVGIVEYEDGKVCKAYPEHIRFCDHIFKDYAFCGKGESDESNLE